MKKVLIVTLPLGKNYGGIMQAYALQSYIRSMGHEVITGQPKTGMLRDVLGLFKARLKGDITRISRVDDALISEHTKEFIDRHIQTLALSRSSSLQNRMGTSGFDLFITGSDQVWRGMVGIYMLDFTGKTRDKISYAASFGVDEPAVRGTTVAKAKKYAQRFTELSVRESSGVTVVKSFWGSQSSVHVDPTLLLKKDDYLSLIGGEAAVSEGRIFEYILDESDSSNEIVRFISSTLGMDVFGILPAKFKSVDEFKLNPGKYTLPPVESWLRGFSAAKYIVTDSFHGVVFSIIFNKPFVAIGNQERGLARFTSLLKMFGLGDRLVTSAEEVTEDLINRPIDWSAVNTKIKYEQGRSFDYLKKHLG